MRPTLPLAIAWVALCLLLPLAVAAAPAVRFVHRWAYWQTPACAAGVCVNVWDRRVDVYRADGMAPDAPADNTAPP